MPIVAALRRLRSAAAVFFGPHGAVAELARQRDTSRPQLYREADAVLHAVDDSALRQQLHEHQQEIERLRGRVADLEQRLQQAVVLDRDRQARFASTAQAEGVSLPVARRLLAVVLKRQTPGVATLGRMTHAAAQRATAALAALDAVSRPRATQAAGDEIFFGRRPCLMVVEPHSLCWLTGQLAERRDGPTWANELRPLVHLQQLTRDAGRGLQKGLALVNAERRRQRQPRVADQEDHFHALREGGRALRKMQQRAARLLAQAEAAQQRADDQRRQGLPSQGLSGAAARAWQRAERALDAWAAADQAWRTVGPALRLFTPAGELNTRARAQAALDAALPQLTGAGWAKTRRLLQRPALLTFLNRVARALAALPVEAELRWAAVRLEGLNRRPEVWQDEGPSAAALRGVRLVARLVLAQAGATGAAAHAAVRAVLRQGWRASSLVECINSVTRMQQARHRKMTQGLLDLKRLYWNCRPFRTGRRRKQTPYALLGVPLPTTDWWELLQLPCEQLRQQLSAPGVAA